MNELQVFSNPDFGTIRTLLIEDVPWMVGKDVASALGYKNPQDAIRNHVDAEDRGVSEVLTPSGIQQMVIINESGMYSLILSSKLPAAKKFKRWVTNEVLPAIRKTGRYSVTDERPLTRDDYLTAARILSGCRNERLPMVVPLLRKAGIEVDYAQSVLREAGRDPDTAKLLTNAAKNHGVSIPSLEKLTGIDSVQLYRMRNGTARYNAARANLIRETLQKLIDVDIDELLYE